MKPFTKFFGGLRRKKTRSASISLPPSGSSHNSDLLRADLQQTSKSEFLEVQNKPHGSPQTNQTSKDFTLPTDSVYSAGDCDALHTQPPADSNSHKNGSVADPPVRKLEPISSESNLQVEQEPQTSSHSNTGSIRVARPQESKMEESATAKLVNLDSSELSTAYDQVPVLEQTKLPRGGVSVETKAVGRVQFGIPPETIKDSMQLGIPVPQVYIVPMERFCREMGPALGVNLAEFEFPAYFNFFVYRKRCTLIVDSEDAEENIRRVFSETLLGPAQFRREENPLAYEEEDFAPDFPREAAPNFAKELQHFRIMPDGKELVIETLLNFCHFETRDRGHDNLGVPPMPSDAGKELGRGLETSSLDTDDEGEDCEAEVVPKDVNEVESREMKNSKWTYSQTQFVGDVAVVWPFEATKEQIENRSIRRVEIFKMPGGTEYILHDVDENNRIVGKARLSGHVKVSELMSVEGFGGHSILDDILPRPRAPLPDKSDYFHPPSFGVTILGNSHGFDKSGSVSGYVLWINGRGVMIDPPPYSSATLEREGIRPRTIVGIILTHCHADHDAGAFQKVLTGSPVVVITTPTIYKSFIRKYAALSALSPALLRHSHRYKPAIIGQPLRFQGATFHFTYTLHTIPCVGFRVEWRGRSMVFTGDHFNNPPAVAKLQETGVLSAARAEDLNYLPLQDTDVLLHEAGAPPIHTPLDVLLKLPSHVKKRLFVVHTSALPEGCELRVAPTGTKGTIRLDQSHPSDAISNIDNPSASLALSASDDFTWSSQNEYETVAEDGLSTSGRFMSMYGSFGNVEATSSGKRGVRSSMFTTGGTPPPLVSMRPASSTDAWFILNLLSAVPFLSSLSYAATMEVLETARVDAYTMGSVIVPASRRSNVLCVVWEGMCAEREAGRVLGRVNTPTALMPITEEGKATEKQLAVWHAGDWTGPIALQPDKSLSGESITSCDHDVVAVSSVGVKVITVEFSSLHRILKSGSPLYRKYLERKQNQERAKRGALSSGESETTETLLDDVLRDLNILELLNCNSALRKLNAVQKRHLESLAEGPISFQPGERLWKAGAPVDKAFVMVSGTASFAQKRRNAGSAAAGNADKNKLGDKSIGGAMHFDAIKAIKELGVKPHDQKDDESSMSSAEVEQENRADRFQFDSLFAKNSRTEGGLAFSDTHDYDKLSRGLQKRADYLTKEGGSVTSENMSVDDQEDIDSCDNESDAQIDYTFTDESDPVTRSKRASVIRRRSSRARFANKVLGRLYSRRAFTGGLVFSRGHFLGDVSKMVAGLLSTEGLTEHHDEGAPSYGFGDQREGQENGRGLDDLAVSDMVIHEQEGDSHILHSSTLTAGKEGCVVLVFPKSSLIPFLDEYPGLLLSLLGTQVVV